MAVAEIVVNGAMMQCVAGSAPATLVVTPDKKVMANKMPAATIFDNVTGKNILPFGTCSILTASASGVPTPCVPAIAAPWAPGSATVKVGKLPALTKNCKLTCTIGGLIQFTQAGQMTVKIS